MDSLTAEHSLAEICALQWSGCVAEAASAFVAMPAEKVRVIAYEEFVRDPVRGLRAICDFLRFDAECADLDHLVRDVSVASVGRGAGQLDGATCTRVEELAAPGRAALMELVGPKL
jgi:hypothetical protein